MIGRCSQRRPISIKQALIRFFATGTIINTRASRTRSRRSHTRPILLILAKTNGGSGWRAADFFDVVGDKMAFIDHHVLFSDSNDFMSFFESRFFQSRYIFIFRDPVQTVLSSAVLWNKDPLPLIRSWASFVKFWADFIRVFPFTMTILHDGLNELKINEVGEFVGLDLSESTRLLDAREQRQHQPADIERGAVATKVAPLLQMIYSEIRESLEMERVFLQADQKRGPLDGIPLVPGMRTADIAVASTPVGRAWNLADRLLNDLQDGTLTKE